uniref:Uncharacterized protein n=1 Tax=Octopus bimaculoides TaxID=37653 RepID=A0A0L8FZ57_OCTBM
MIVVFCFTISATSLLFPDFIIVIVIDNKIQISKKGKKEHIFRDIKIMRLSDIHAFTEYICKISEEKMATS